MYYGCTPCANMVHIYLYGNEASTFCGILDEAHIPNRFVNEFEFEMEDDPLAFALLGQFGAMWGFTEEEVAF